MRDTADSDRKSRRRGERVGVAARMVRRAADNHDQIARELLVVPVFKKNKLPGGQKMTDVILAPLWFVCGWQWGGDCGVCEGSQEPNLSSSKVAFVDSRA